MTIRPGSEWGEAVDRPPDLVAATSDADLADLVRRGVAPLAVQAGDVHRFLGGAAPRTVMQRVEMDGFDVVVDERTFSGVAHVTIHRTWWWGPVIAVCNVGQIGRWNVAPRAHPNDGRLDVVEVAPSMSIRRRLQARARLPSGTHLPHPEISTRSGTSFDWMFETPLRVRVDGIDMGSGRSITVIVRPDRFRLHI